VTVCDADCLSSYPEITVGCPCTTGNKDQIAPIRNHPTAIEFPRVDWQSFYSKLMADAIDTFVGISGLVHDCAKGRGKKAFAAWQKLTRGFLKSQLSSRRPVLPADAEQLDDWQNYSQCTRAKVFGNLPKSADLSAWRSTDGDTILRRISRLLIFHLHSRRNNGRSVL
jgi:hypothetical protein